MYRQTGDEDGFDPYEGNDEDALDYISGEIDFDRYVESMQDMHDSDDPRNCACWDESNDLCSTCEHDIECDRPNCGDEGHVLSVKFGNPTSCSCANFSDVVRCNGCGHKESCYEERLFDCEAGRHSAWVAYMDLDFCECDQENAENGCAECAHEADCENTSFCSCVEFHQLAKSFGVTSESAISSVGLVSNAGKYWTAEEDERLIGAYSASRTFSEIAIEHGRTEKSIWMRLVHLSFQNEPEVAIMFKSKKFELSEWQASQIEVLATSYTAGVSPATLSEVLDLNIVDIARKIVELGLANPKVLPKYRQVKNFRRWTSAELTQLREDFRNKLTIDLMAENAGRSKFAVLSTLYSIGEITDNEVNDLIHDASSKAYGD
ncbi:MAG: hypothetical protein RI927_621 [Actinomycetota bacterium]|jgi:hypothetical protein